LMRTPTRATRRHSVAGGDDGSTARKCMNCRGGCRNP
jgi:hypothetical protein